jgi:hypothetical protein
MLQDFKEQLFAAELPVKVRWLPSPASNIYHTELISSSDEVLLFTA